MELIRENHKPGTARASYVEMTQVVLPQFTNSVGTVFGGQVMSWIDICAAVSCQRHARSAVVTASIDSVSFLKPIKAGFVVVLKSQINAAFRTSMEVGVTVYAENPLTGECNKAMQAFCTFVALGADSKPKPVPELIFETEEEENNSKAANKRREFRLKQR